MPRAGLLRMLIIAALTTLPSTIGFAAPNSAVYPGDQRLRDRPAPMYVDEVQHRATQRAVQDEAVVDLLTAQLSVPGHENWQAEFFPLGVSGYVEAVASFDGEIIVGGRIWSAGKVAVSNLARWDGSNWSSLGEPNGWVNALYVYDGMLVVGGEFTRIGGIAASHLAAWDGTNWYNLGAGGLERLFVTALAVYRGKLVAGVTDPYSFIEGSQLIYERNADQWTSLNFGTGDYPGKVNAMTVFRGELVAAVSGGWMVPSIASWNGKRWTDLTPGHRQGILALEVHKGHLIAGGDFTSMDGAAMQGIAEYDGDSWTPLGQGIACTEYPCPGVAGHVNALLSINGSLIAAGRFTLAGETRVQNVARWNGKWSDIDGGIDKPGSPYEGINCLVAHEGSIVAGGQFVRAGSITAQNIAIYSGTWQAVARPGGQPLLDEVHAAVEWQGKLVVGGYFERAGSEAIKYVAVWDGQKWSGLGNGPGGEIASLTVYHGDLIAAGYVNPVSYRQKYVVRWDGTQWSRVGGAFDASIWALSVYNDELIAGGYFTHVEGNPCPGIARWDGNAWHSLGAGLLEANPEYTFVGSFAELGSDLVAAGNFTRSGQQQLSPCIARWNGTSWISMGAGFNKDVLSLAVYDGSLIAGGSFTMSGNVSVRYIGRWTGSGWGQLGDPVSAPTEAYYANVADMAVLDDKLIATGHFDHAGAVHARGIAEWNGAAWTPLGSGLSSNFSYWAYPSVLTVLGSDLYVAGLIDFAGDKPSVNIAKWSPAPSLQAGARVGSERLRTGDTHPQAVMTSTHVSFELSSPGRVVLQVFDLAGREVAVPLSREFAAGVHDFTWEPGSSRGATLSAGVYFYRLVTPDGITARKLLVR